MGPRPQPSGNPVGRRAIQLGLRGEALVRYAKEWLLGVEDISDFVAGQRGNATAPYERLVLPREDVYPVADTEVVRRLTGVGRGLAVGIGPIVPRALQLTNAELRADEPG